MKKIAVAALSILLGACALPETNVKTGSQRPQLVIHGAPVGTVLIVDGLSMGLAPQFNGNPKVLIVEEGIHQVEIRRSGKAIHTEKTFVSNGETRIIAVHMGAQ